MSESTNVTRASLAAKHGTPAQFARAVRNAIGEISVQEAADAIAAYEVEWALATDDLINSPPFGCDPED